MPKILKTREKIKFPNQGKVSIKSRIKIQTIFTMKSLRIKLNMKIKSKYENCYYNYYFRSLKKSSLRNSQNRDIKASPSMAKKSISKNIIGMKSIMINNMSDKINSSRSLNKSNQSARMKLNIIDKPILNQPKIGIKNIRI